MTIAWRVALIAALGVAVAGLADAALTAAGYVALARVVWAVGFGFTVLVVWYLWLRPMDITGPSG